MNKKRYTLAGLFLAATIALTACGQKDLDGEVISDADMRSFDEDMQIVPYSEVASDLPDLSGHEASPEEQAKIQVDQHFQGDEELVYKALHADEKDKLQSPSEFFVYQILLVHREEQGDKLDLYALIHAESFIAMDKEAEPAQTFTYPVKVTYTKKDKDYVDPQIHYPKPEAEVVESVEQVAGDNKKAKDALMAAFDDGMWEKEFTKVRDGVLKEQGLTLKAQ